MKGIYQTNDKHLIDVEISDIGELQDNLYESDDGEFYIELTDLKKLKGNIEPELFEALEKAIKADKHKEINFRVY